MIQFRQSTYRCTSEIAIELISGKWKALILNYLDNHIFRFNELQRLMPGTTQKMLTAQLRDLEKDGLITRKVYPVSPPKVEYQLSELGRSLVPILNMLSDYGAKYIEAMEGERGLEKASESDAPPAASDS
jgi:Predicted transcriptional regulators